VTPPGIVIPARFEQDWNAESPMLLTLPGIVTLVRWETVIERIVRYVGDTIGDRDVGQAVAAPKGATLDSSDVAGNRDTGQAGAVRECVVSDVGDADRKS